MSRLGARGGALARGRAAGLAAVRARRRAGGGRGGRQRDPQRSCRARRARAPARALSITYGLFTRVRLVGPAVGGLLIAAAGVEGAYIADAAGCLCHDRRLRAAATAAPARRARGPAGSRAIAKGCGSCAATSALMGSFAIDLAAMTFGMPRALFAVLCAAVYDAGAAGTGLLYAAVSAGRRRGGLTTGWLERARRLGRIVMVAVVVWGLGVAVAGACRSLWIAAALLAVAGAAELGERGVPLHDRSDRDLGCDARAHVLRVHDRGQRAGRGWGTSRRAWSPRSPARASPSPPAGWRPSSARSSSCSLPGAVVLRRVTGLCEARTSGL